MGAAAALAALAAAIVYARHDLALSHYDARAHLVVARRVLDSLTPNWAQIGAVWLPLPHLLNVIPVQWDWAYRTGASAVLISIISMGVSAFACARLLERVTGSRLAGAACAALLVTNANLLYLHSTAMTEPLLLALAFLTVERLEAWLRDPWQPAAMAGVPIVLLCLTRYEGWALTGAAMAVAFVVIAVSPDRTLHRWLRLALWPAAAVAAFLLLSKGSTDAWFVTGGFFTPDNPARGDIGLVFEQLREGVETLSSPALAGFGALGFVAVALRGAASREQRPLLVVLALAGMAALPFLAFHAGHPFRIRYMTPLVASAALFTGFAIGFAPAIARVIVAGVAAFLIVPGLAPFDHMSAMVVEARREEPSQRGRTAVTRALRQVWDGSPILISMGSLGHYMHDLGREGFDIAHFLHEGNGEIWPDALRNPALHARFLLVEEYAEGGDAFAQVFREHPELKTPWTRIAEGGNVVLYRRIY